MKVLVTGGAGFIGSFIVDRCVEKGHEVTIFDNLDPQVHVNGTPPDYLNKEARFLKGDVRNYDILSRAVEEAEIIFHEAGAVGVGQSQYQIKKYVDINTGGTANLLDILVNTNNKVQKLILSASMSSYGEGVYHCETCGPVRPQLRPVAQMEKGEWEVKCPHCEKETRPVPTDESAVQHCNSIYAFTKKDQEDMVMNIGTVYSLPVVSLRYFNTYGPRQSLSNPYTGVTAIFMSRIKNGHSPVIYEDGLQTRDFISVYDIVEANMLAMEKEEANYNIFNVGSGKPIPIKEIAETLAVMYEKDIEPEITYTFRKGDIRHCYADISNIQNKLNFAPKVDFKTGVANLIEWSRTAHSEDRFEIATDELKRKGIL